MDDLELLRMLRRAEEPEAVARSPWRAAIVSLAIFAGMALLIQQIALHSLLLVTAAILLHELGHFLCMRWFGFHNVQLFFIPFLGGLATGTKHAVPDWQNAVVLFAGPIPGLLVATVILASMPKEITVVTPDVLPFHMTLLFDSANVLLALNAFNLLPFIPFDGGRIVQLIIGPTRIFLGAILVALSLVAIVWLTVSLKMWLLAILPVPLLLSCPGILRRRLAVATLRKQAREYSNDLARIDEEQGRQLLTAAKSIASREFWSRFLEPGEAAEHVVQIAKELHGLLTAKPLSMAGSILVTVVYVASWSLPALAVLDPVKIHFVTNHAPSP